MAKKNKKSKKKNRKTKKADTSMPEQRNPVALIAAMRNSAGFMKPKNQRRQNRKSWKKDVEAALLNNHDKE